MTQTSIDDPWWQQDDPETFELMMGIEGVGVVTHDVMPDFLSQEFDTDEDRRQFIEERLNSMALELSIEWRNQR